MTVALAVKVNDGLVMAADSASTLIAGVDQAGNQFVTNVYNNADKIFNLYKGKPIGCSTWGLGGIGSASISTLAKDLRQRFMGCDSKQGDWKIDLENYSLEEVAGRVRQFFFEEHYKVEFKSAYEQIAPEMPEKIRFPGQGFMMTGYSSGAELPEVWVFEVQPNGECPAPKQVVAQGQSGIAWFGQPEAIFRLVKGFSPLLSQALLDLGVPPDQIEPAIQQIGARLEVPLHHAAMPIQDAIDLAEFLVRLTIDFSRFTPGAPTVGGPIEIASITKHEGFKWIRRKHYFNVELNSERHS